MGDNVRIFAPFCKVFHRYAGLDPQDQLQWGEYMSKLYRSLLWSGLVVAGVAACGDDVTVAPPPNQGVQSVTVGPTGVTISVGQTLQMAAAVNADAGVATTVTWTSSNPATASVNPTSGLVTGVASGSVAITACSTVATGVCGQATVTVAATTPAVISIKSITNTVAGTGEVPVNINNVAGQINVTMNLDAGTQTVSSVDVLVDGAVACSQGFSAIQLATARAQAALIAGDTPNAALVVEIQCSINTAEFNTTTGIAKFLNGAHQVSARVNLVGSAPVATPSTQLVFNNTSGFVVTLTTNNGTDPGSAIDPRTGLQWLGGSVTLNFLGVSYVSGATISNISFPLFGKTVNAALTAGVGSITYSEGTTWTATNTGIGNYLSLPTGEPLPIGTAVLSNGQPLAVPNAILNASTSPPGNTTILPLTTIRVDNTAPGVTSANLVAQAPITQPLMTAVWVNATTSFTAGNAALGVPSLATLNALTAGTDVEEGVDAITVTFFVTALGAALPSGCSTTGLTAITTGSQLAETTVSLSFRVRIIFKDALGNITCFSLAPGGVAGAQFGADFTAPTGTVTGPAAGPPGLNVDPGNFVVTASDNASGFDPLGNALLVSMTRVGVSGATVCVIGTGSGCTAIVQPLTFDATGGPNTEGYYTTTITLVDQAGNQTVLVTARLYEFDATVPGFSGGISLPALIAGATTNTFTASVTDNLDLNTIFGDVTYPTAVLRYPSQTIGSWGVPLEQGPTTVNYAVANWIRCINNAGDFATLTNQPSVITLTVDDQALNVFSQASGAFGVNAQACGAVGAVTINSFIQNAPSYGTGLTQVDIDGASLAAASSTTVTLVAVADVPLNSAVDPFARVEFYYDNGLGVLVKAGTATAVLAQTLTNRTYTYTFVWNPDAAVPVGAVNVVALGVDAQGDAVLTAAQVVTTVP